MGSNYNIERGFITKLLATKDILSVKDMQIKPAFFTGDNRKAYRYINDVYFSSGEMPTIRVFKEKFPDYKLDTYNGEFDTEESLKFWCDELRKKVIHNTLVDNVEKVVDNLENMNTEEAYNQMKKTILVIENGIVETSAIDITKDTASRKQLYLERVKKQGMLGIPMGIDQLDYVLKGMQNKQLITLIASTGLGKAVTLDTPVLTPIGYIPMKDIQVGSRVCSSDGKFYNVSAIYPHKNKETYRVSFEDGTFVDCCEDHLWKFKTTDDIRRKKSWRVESVKQILEKYPIKRNKTFNISIPVCKEVEFSKSSLPIHPYVLGCLLGDGGFTTDRITFTNPEKDIVNKLNFLLKIYGEFVYHKGTSCQYVFKSNDTKFNYLYRSIKSLNLLGCKSATKFIPSEYKLSSIADRKHLLKGLIDTDGNVDKKGAVNFSTKSIQLANDVMFIVRSLGMRCTLSKYDRSLEGKGTEYHVNIRAKSNELFSSEKHTNRYNKRIVPNKEHHYELLKVTSITKLNIKQDMQCITVDSPDHTFICGDFIVTHNTWFECIIGAYAQLNNYRVLQITTEMSEEQMRDRYEAILMGKMCGEFNYSKFKSGKLEQAKVEEYFDFLDNTMPHLEELIIDTATGVTDISAKIDQYNPDLILIDGAYLLEDDRGADQDWLRIAHITRDLKTLAKVKNKPIFINSQADSNTSIKKGPELGNIGYSKAIGQDCLPKDTFIATEHGNILIQNLQGEVFKIFDGYSYKKARCVYAGEKEQIKIKFRGSEFICSPNHKLYVFDNEINDFVWKRAKDLEPKNDFILENNQVLMGGYPHLLRVDTTRGNKEMNIPIEATKELGKLIGIFIGDGSIRPYEKGQVTVSCGYDLEYANECIRLVSKYFNLEGQIKKVKTKYSTKDQLVCTWYSRAFSDWLQFFIEPNKDHKEFRKDLLEMNLDFRIGLLSGLIESDGSTKGQVEFVTIHKELAEGVNLLCKTLGIMTRLDKQPIPKGTKYRLRLRSKDLKKAPLQLNEYKNTTYKELLNSKANGGYTQPKNYVLELMKNVDVGEFNPSIQSSMYIARREGKCSLEILQLAENSVGLDISNKYKFIQVDEVIHCEEKVSMWDIQIYSNDKRMITNGIVTHNSDVVLALFRDENMIDDNEMQVKVLKQREGILCKVMINWDFRVMNFDPLYTDYNEDKQSEPVVTLNQDDVLGE